MKTTHHSKSNKAIKFIRINQYTWVEKKVDEPDEVTRQKFLMKLSGGLHSSNWQPDKKVN